MRRSRAICTLCVWHRKQLSDKGDQVHACMSPFIASINNVDFVTGAVAKGASCELMNIDGGCRSFEYLKTVGKREG